MDSVGRASRLNRRQILKTFTAQLRELMRKLLAEDIHRAPCAVKIPTYSSSKIMLNVERYVCIYPHIMLETDAGEIGVAHSVYK